MYELNRMEMEAVSGGVTPWSPPGYTPPIEASREEAVRLLEQILDLLERQNHTRTAG